MYKEFIISIIIIISIFTLDKVTTQYLEESVDIISENLQSLKEISENENINNEEVEKKINYIYEEWKKRYEKLAYYIEHDELEKVETKLVGIKSNIETNENEQEIEKIDEAIFLLEHIKNKDSLNLKNIF